MTRKNAKANKALEHLTKHEESKPYLFYYYGRNCPYCNTPYRHINDHDNTIPCVMCEGSARKAHELSECFESLLNYATETQDIELLTRMDNAVKASFWGFETGRRIRAYKKTHECIACEGNKIIGDETCPDCGGKGYY